MKVIDIARQIFDSTVCEVVGEGDVVTEGDWTVNFECWPVEFSELEQQIVTRLVNENIEHGCCGGCL